jgi:hypothetical protein
VTVEPGQCGLDHGLLTAEPGDLLRRPVPGGDPPLRRDGEHTVGDGNVQRFHMRRSWSFGTELDVEYDGQIQIPRVHIVTSKEQ